MQRFQTQFQAALQNCLDEPARPDSLVLEAVSGRGSIYELVRRDEAIRRVEALIDELTFNIKRTASIAATAKKNLNTQSGGIYPTTHLRLSCCELLMSTRYLDCEKNVYSRVERAYGKAATLNAQLMLWERKPTSTEKFVLKIQTQIESAFSSLLADLEKLLKQLESRTYRP